MKGMIFNIQRFSIHDGPGIRTTVFLKGCPLNCAWCHNPESKSYARETFFDAQKCILCGACVGVCERGARSIADASPSLDRERCIACGSCAEVCPTCAAEICGEERDTESIMSEVMRDEAFYRTSGGGMTLSGGEPLLQYDFSLSLLREARRLGINTAVETSGYTDRDLSEMAEEVDLWLFDLKHTDSALHREFVGVSNEKIIRNLRYLDSLGASIVLRLPIIKGVNMTEEHIDAVGRIALELRRVVGIDLEPYHPLGVDKAERIGKRQGYDSREFLDKEELIPLADRLRDLTGLEVRIS